MSVADGTAAFREADLAHLERHLRCLACNGAVEHSLMILGSLRCLACRETNAPLDPALFEPAHPG
jgi:hypothetical protein